MIIKQNKGHTFFLAAVSLLFTVLFLLFAFAEFVGVFRRLLCLLCVALLGATTVYAFRQLFSKEPLIEICDEYFYDNSSAISLGKIAWEDMERAYVKSGVLNIDLKNPEEYIARMNWLQRFFIKGNVKMKYGNVCISTERMKKHKKEFFEEFEKRMPLE